jgi:hypothetical protein
MTQMDVCPGGSGYVIAWTNPVSFSDVPYLLGLNVADRLLTERCGILSSDNL